MTDTSGFDNKEKIDTLLKTSFSFPTTSEKKEWYEETAVKYSNYLNGEDLFLDNIPSTPDFNISGTIIDPQTLGLESSDFINYENDNNNKAECSIVDDSTGKIRRYKNLILEECPELGSDPGASWFKLDSDGNNILSDAFQFNYKQDGAFMPYLYSLYTQKSINTPNPDLPFGSKGGNWFLEGKSGIIFFSDFNNFSNGVQTNSNFQINITDNKPVLTFYKYIGRKGISYLNEKIEYLQTQLDEFEISNNPLDQNTLNSINNLLSDVSNIKIEVSNNYINISNILLDISSINNNINYIKTDLSNLSYDFNILKNDFSRNIIDISNLKNDISNNFINIFTDISLIFNDINYFSYDLSNVKNDISNLNIALNNNTNDISNINVDISNLSSLVNNNTDDISNLSSLVNNNTDDISNLSSLVNNNTNDISNLNNDISNLNNDISNLTSIVNNDISNLSIVVNNNTNDISNLNNDISNFKYDISGLNINVNNNTNDISNLNNDISNLNNDISNLKYDISGLNNSINVNISDISYIKNIISDICGYEFLQKIYDNSQNIEIIDNDISNIIFKISELYTLLEDISHDSHDLSFSKIFDKITDLTNKDFAQDLSFAAILDKITDLSNRDFSFNKYLSKEIAVLNYQNNLTKTDIFYNRTLIDNNTNQNDIIKSKIKNIDENITSLNSIVNDICYNIFNSEYKNEILYNIVKDISESLIDVKEELLGQNVLIKGDIIISNSNIEYNLTKIELLEKQFNDIFIKNDLLNNTIKNLKNSINDLCNNIINRDVSNIVYNNSEILLNLYNQDNLIKSDVILSNSNIEYCETKIEILDKYIEIINNSLNNLYQKTNNYNINNLYLYYQDINIVNNKIHKLDFDYTTTYKNGYMNNIIFQDEYITFNKLENLFTNNNSLFVEIYCSCFIENLNNGVVNNIKLDLSNVNNEYDNSDIDIDNLNIGNSYVLNNKQHLLLGPSTYKLSKNIEDVKSIFYKNKYLFNFQTQHLAKIYNIKIIIKVLNYK